MKRSGTSTRNLASCHSLRNCVGCEKGIFLSGLPQVGRPTSRRKRPQRGVGNGDLPLGRRDRGDDDLRHQTGLFGRPGACAYEG